MPVRLLWPHEYEEILQEAGCELVAKDFDGLDGNQLWRTPRGYAFFIPIVDPDRLCPHHRLHQILTELRERERA